MQREDSCQGPGGLLALDVDVLLRRLDDAEIGLVVDVVLEEYLVQAITRGSDEIGKVHVQLAHDGRTFNGFGANVDILTASAWAYLDALSKIIK